MRILFLLAFLSTVTACSSVPPVPELIGGSRADGFVEIGYNFGLLSSPSREAKEAAEESLLNMAKSSCSEWGYSDALPMGPSKRRCAYNAPEGQACYKYTQVYKYQCGS